ncbi:hypothetical protein AOLI_G00253370, partial [Acnodon oligacanthus]
LSLSLRLSFPFSFPLCFVYLFLFICPLISLSISRSVCVYIDSAWFSTLSSSQQFSVLEATLSGSLLPPGGPGAHIVPLTLCLTLTVTFKSGPKVLHTPEC